MSMLPSNSQFTGLGLSRWPKGAGGEYLEGFLLLSGDETDGDDAILLSGDATDGDDKLMYGGIHYGG